MTTKTATVRARIEPHVKKRAESVLHKIGISPSEAINVFYRKVAQDDGIPFALHVPNKDTRKAMADISRGRGKTATFLQFAESLRSVSHRA